MDINFFYEEVDFLPKIKKSKIKRISKSIRKHYSIKFGTINCIFCSNEYIKKINTQYLSHDYATDVITFNSIEEQRINADIFIGVQEVYENSIEYNTTPKFELYRVMIHGLLHSVGLNDSTQEEKTIMRETENKYLRLIGKIKENDVT